MRAGSVAAPEEGDGAHPAKVPPERNQPQPQDPPQQPPPEGAGAERPPAAATVSSRTVSSWPRGQVAGSADEAIGRDSMNVVPQARQRNS